MSFMKKTAPVQNDVKYKNGRMSLLLIVILSVVNIFSIIFSDSYFLFSAYFPQQLILIGYELQYETQEAFWLIFTGILAFITIFPYLLCWLFSKKRVGWMIAALVLFSLDSLLFLYDFVFFLAAGDFSMIIDLVIRIWAIGSLVLGVKYGIKMKKTPPSEEATLPEDGSPA